MLGAGRTLLERGAGEGGLIPFLVESPLGLSAAPVTPTSFDLQDRPNGPLPFP